MRFIATDFDDAWQIEPEPQADQRGFFARTFCTHEFGGRGLETKFVQHAISRTDRKGSLRGMHFQIEPYAEVKVVTCVKGAIFDVIVDLRTNSPSFLRWQGFELTGENYRRVYIPKGFAHGFQTLRDDTEAAYLISAFHAPDAASGVRYDDPAFAIRWPYPVTVISQKDRGWPDYHDHPAAFTR